MKTIKLHRNEQLYRVADDKALVAVSIELDRTNHTVTTISYHGIKRTYPTNAVGVINLDTDEDTNNIESYDFIDEFGDEAVILKVIIKADYSSYDEASTDLMNQGVKHLGWLNGGVILPKDAEFTRVYQNRSSSSCLYCDVKRRISYSVDMGD